MTEDYCVDKPHFENLFALEEYKQHNSENNYVYIPTYTKCQLRMFDFLNCPIVVDSDINSNANYSKFCKFTSENQFYTENCDGSGRKCLSEFFMKEGSFGYESLNKTQGIFETKELHEENIGKFFKEQAENNHLSSFPRPQVPVTIIYTQFINTRSGSIYKKGDPNFQWNNNTILYYGGDGSVPSISSLYPGLKWAYEHEKQMDKDSSGVQFVEFCSLLNKDEKFGYKSFQNVSNDNHFIGIGCECLNDDGSLILENIEKGLCTHSTMVNDIYLIRFVQNIISINPTHDKLSDYPADVQEAIKSYTTEMSYENACNILLSRGI